MATDKKYRIVIQGARLMMRNEHLANPFNPYAIELSKFTKKRGKSVEDHLSIAEIEFQGGLYYDKEHGPYIPARCLNKMLVQGARRRKLGKTFEQMVIVEQEVNPVQYEGPRDRKELWGATEPDGTRTFADMRLVGVNAARTLRTRPLFRNWACEFVVTVLDGTVNAEDIEAALEAAQVIGMLDGRPTYAGQFTVRSFEEVADAAA